LSCEFPVKTRPPGRVFFGYRHLPDRGNELRSATISVATEPLKIPSPLAQNSCDRMSHRNMRHHDFSFSINIFKADQVLHRRAGTITLH